MSGNKAVRILAAAALAGMLCSCSPDAGTEPMLTERAESSGGGIELATAELGRVYRVTSAEAVVTYPVSEDVFVDFDNAVLLAVHFNKGDEVREGDLLAEFEIPYSAAELEELYSRLEIAQTELGARQLMLESELAEAEQRFESSGTESDRIRAEICRENLDYFLTNEKEKRLSEAQEEVDSFLARLEDNKIYAPMDGVVSDIAYLREGRSVDRGQLLCRIYDPSELLLSCQTDIANGMRYNEYVTVKVSRQEETYTGRIVSAPNVFGESVGRVTVRLVGEDAENFDPDERLRIITIVANRYLLEDVLVVPQNSVQNEDGSRYVSLYEDGMIKKRYVTVGLSGGGNIQILDGLSAGQTVVD